MSNRKNRTDFGRKVHFHLPMTGDITFCSSCGKTYGHFNDYCKECGYCQCNIIKISLPSIIRPSETTKDTQRSETKNGTDEDETDEDETKDGTDEDETDDNKEDDCDDEDNIEVNRSSDQSESD